MIQHSESKALQPQESDEEALMAGVFLAPHEEKWAHMGEDDAAFMRGALLKAQAISQRHGQLARIAYLEGIADQHEAFEVKKLVGELVQFNPDQEFQQLGPAA